MSFTTGLLGEASFSIRGEYTKALSDLQNASNAIKTKLDEIEQRVIAKAGEKAGKNFWSKFSIGGKGIDILKGIGIGTSIYGATRAIKGTLLGSLTAFKDFEFEMATVQAKANATTEEFKAMENAAKHFGQTTFYNAKQVAGALKILVEMGLDAKESVEALPQVLTLATTESMDLARAADIALGSMRGMGMNTHELQRIVDGLAFTSAKSASTVESLGQGLKVAGAAAHISGQSLEDVLSVLGGLSNQMIRNETAGFAVTQMIARLTRAASGLGGVVDETGSTLGKARETIRKLGIDLLTTEGKLKPLPQLFTELKEKGASPLEMLRLFGVYTYKYALAAINASDAINELNTELTDARELSKGWAQQMADWKLDTLEGQLTIAKNALYNLRIEIGKAFSQESIWLVKNFGKVVRGVAEDVQRLGKWAFIPGGDIFKGTYDFFKGLFGNGKNAKNEIDETLKPVKDAYEWIMERHSILKYNKWKLPEWDKQAFEEQHLAVLREIEENSEQVEESLKKRMKKVYASEEGWSLAHLRAELQENADDLLDIQEDIRQSFFLSIQKFNTAPKINLETQQENLNEFLEAVKRFNEEMENLKKHAGRMQITTISDFAQSWTTPRLKAENSKDQENARIAESFTRLSSMMKENSTEYFEWKLKALNSQQIKELAIVKDTEEGKYLVEKAFAEARKQLKYQEIERIGTFTEGMGVYVSKLHDVGMELGQMGEEFVANIRSGTESAFANFFENVITSGESFKDTMLGLFKSLSDSLLKISSELLSQLLIKWAIMKFLGFGTSSMGSFNANAGNYEGLGTSSTLFSNLGSSGMKASPMRLNTKTSGNEPISMQNVTNLNISATDVHSFRKMLKRDGDTIQKIIGNGVRQSMGYASELRGKRG